MEGRGARQSRHANRAKTGVVAGEEAKVQAVPNKGGLAGACGPVSPLDER